MAWRYLAQRLTVDGPGEIFDLDLPLVSPRLTEVLSGPSQLSATIPVEFARLKGPDGRPVLEEWGTAIYAEADGQIRSGDILVRSSWNESGEWGLEGMGFTGYSHDLPYLDSTYGVEVDPLDRVRHIWEHIQTRHSNIDLVVDDTTSPVRIGTELEQVAFDTQAGPVSFEAGPHKLAWWLTHNLQAEVDKLAEETPFDYAEEHAWNQAGDVVEHRMRLWYPGKGSRRHDLRFVLGENVQTVPQVAHEGDDFANATYALGAGEGRDMIRSDTLVSPDDQRLRRVAVIADKSLRSKTAANEAARRELAMRLQLDEITSVIVEQHTNANIFNIPTGDEIRLQGETGWNDLDVWCRVLSRTLNPDDEERVELSLLRSDRVA